MTEDGHPDMRELEEMVRAHLLAQAARVDTRSLVHRLRNRLDQATAETAVGGTESDLSVAADSARGVVASDSPHRTPSLAPPRAGRWAWAVAVAASIFAAFLGGRYLVPLPASAVTLVREAKQAHTRAVDRCYRVVWTPQADSPNSGQVARGAQETTLWTRGDRFWARSPLGNSTLISGRDERGQLWCTASRQHGVLFDSHETDFPPEIALVCDVNCMSIPLLLDGVLADFDLRWEASAADSAAATHLVSAELKPGRRHATLESAVIEIDAASNVVVRLTLSAAPGARASGTVTYTLVETATQPDEQYRLEAHIDRDAKITSQAFEPAATR